MICRSGMRGGATVVSSGDFLDFEGLKSRVGRGGGRETRM